VKEVPNKELLFSFSPNIIWVIKSGKIRGAEHVAHVGKQAEHIKFNSKTSNKKTA
jgi:hypothetical protein